MCNCKNVDFGTNVNATFVRFPDHMKTYRENRVKAGLSDGAMIDNCALSEIINLWVHGIHTRGVCCGHNKVVPSVAVALESIPKMKELGYKQWINKSRRDIFKLLNCKEAGK